MKSFIAVATLFVSCISAEYYPAYKEEYTYLQDKYPQNSIQTEVIPRGVVGLINKKVNGANKKLRAGKPISYLHRTAEDCTYPLEVVIVQDVTGSFTDDMPVMANSELPVMFDTLSETHPGSSFGIVSFADKPILPFGYPPEPNYRDDYCYLLDAPLGQNLADLTGVYNNYLASGGADPPENQYGAIVNTLQAKKIGWGSNPDAIRLVVLVTDAPPHYDDANGGVDRHGMAAFSGTFEEDNINGQCTAQFYPSWQETIRQINAPVDGGIPPYVAFLVYDDGADGKTLDTWQWFASQIYENNSFVRERAEDSSNFWEELSQIIGIMDSVECQPISSTTPTPTTTTTDSTSTTTDNGSGIPAGSTETTETSTADPATTTTTTGTTDSTTASTVAPCPPCPCPGPDPCDHCHNHCGNEAYIRYPIDVKEIDVHIVA